MSTGVRTGSSATGWYGLDGSVSFANLEDQNDLVTRPAIPDVTIEGFSASRLRLGYAFDNFMIFAAGGFSLAKANVDDGLADDDAWLKGFTVGAGIEAKFAENWSARVEYLYINYATEQRTIFSAAAKSLTTSASKTSASSAAVSPTTSDLVKPRQQRTPSGQPGGVSL